MLAKAMKLVFDLYKWLPSYGETEVSLCFKGLNLEVFITYDYDVGGDTQERTKKLLFTGVCSFFISSDPGVESLCVKYDELGDSGALMEYGYSEMAEMWQKHLNWREKPIKHFQLFFLSENKRLEVFAEDCQLVEE